MSQRTEHDSRARGHGHLTARKKMRLRPGGPLAALLFVLACGTALRLWCLANAVSVTRDAAAHYLPQALAISELRLDDAFEPGIPPLYPVLGGIMTAIVGDTETGCRLVSLVAGLAAVILAWRITGLLFGDWPSALLAAGLVAFHPYHCRYSASVGPDALAATLLLAVAASLIAYLQAPSAGRTVPLGLSLAALALTRPEGFAYAAAALAMMVLVPVAKAPYPRRKRLLHAALLVGIACLLCLPRLAWTHAKTGQWVVDARQATVPARLLQAIRQGSLDFGQIRLWRRGGLEALAGTAESFGAAFGPVALVCGIYGLLRRPKSSGSSLVWALCALIVFGIAVVFVGHRVSRRYLLGPAMLWQVIGGYGLAAVAVTVAARTSRNGQIRPIKPQHYATLILLVGLPQMPWALVRLGSTHVLERRAGEWILTNLGPSQRIVSRDAIPAWYARGSHIAWPGVSRSNRYPYYLARYARAHRGRIIVVDHRLVRPRNPAFLESLRRGRWPYGRILTNLTDGRRTLTLLEVEPAQSPAARASPR